jgi:hypothetical protein
VDESESDVIELVVESVLISELEVEPSSDPTPIIPSVLVPDGVWVDTTAVGISGLDPLNMGVSFEPDDWLIIGTDVETITDVAGDAAEVGVGSICCVDADRLSISEVSEAIMPETSVTASDSAADIDATAVTDSVGSVSGTVEVSIVSSSDDVLVAGSSESENGTVEVSAEANSVEGPVADSEGSVAMVDVSEGADSVVDRSPDTSSTVAATAVWSDIEVVRSIPDPVVGSEGYETVVVIVATAVTVVDASSDIVMVCSSVVC